MSSFASEIYDWFLQYKRDLPWRNTSDPYKIWISEIILQQTRVATGIQYYNRFIEKYPSIQALANATEDEVLKLWQGLGYYSRARNLHFTAKIISERYNGKFPDNYNSILELKGVGKYTAAAIASIAFNLPYAAVDGNVQRVIARFYGIHTPIDSNAGIKEIQSIADEILIYESAGLHNQAFMEFGALHCTPKSPNCRECPVSHGCVANKNRLTEILPVKTKKIKQSNRFFYYYILEGQEFVLLEKRNGNDIWRNLYQFPLYESKRKLSDSEVLDLKMPFEETQMNIKSLSKTIKHVLTHQKIYARFIHIETKSSFYNDSKYIRVNKKDIYKFAVPKLLEQYIQKTDFL